MTLGYSTQDITEEDIQAVVEVLRSSHIVDGPKTKEFEEKLCETTGAKHCVVVSSCTAALTMSTSVLAIAPGFEAITTPMTFVPTSNAAISAGLVPVLVDIEKDSHNIDPTRIQERLSDRTRLIIPVHYAGQPANMQRIHNIAQQRGLHVIEDAAHALGSRYACGSPVGSCKYSMFTLFSFHPVKAIATGQGGAITTNNTAMYEKLLQLRTHGITKKPERFQSGSGDPWHWEMQLLSFNYRMTDMQAALGVSQLKRLHQFVERRRAIVERYNEAFRHAEQIATPRGEPNVYSAFHLYAPEFDFEQIGKTRKSVFLEIKDRSIGTAVLYIPVHLQPYYRERYGYSRGDFPNTERFYERMLCLPLYPKLTNEEVEYVVETVLEVTARQA